MGRTEGVVHRGRGGVVVGRRVRRIECQQRCRGRGIQVDADADAGGGSGRNIRHGQLQVAEGAGDVAGGVRQITGQMQAGAVGDKPLAVDAKGAGARVDDGAVVAQAEEALAVHGEIQIVVGEIDIALGELLRHRGQLDAAADGVGAGTRARYRVDVGELGTRQLETVGAAVGDVIADGIEVGGGCIQPADRCVHRHDDSPSRLR